VAQKLEATEKKADAAVEVRRTDDTAVVMKGGAEIHVDSHVFTLHQAGGTASIEGFTREVFEDALDRVSRPVKGKYANVPYSSEDLIRDKRKEVELEDRQQ
jgi:hypothetical protein